MATITPSGAASRLLEQFALHPLTPDERVTAQSMLQDPSSRVLVMPTHHINEMGDFMGFRFTCNAYAKGNHLPVVRTMFHGHTLVQCQLPDETMIMRLMASREQNKARMLEFLQEIERECVPATLDCVPENASSVTRHGTLEATGLLTVDSQHWTPEVPDRIGVYHAYIRGYNRDVRAHRLFIVCSGGMARASDAFCNLVIDAGKNCTAQDIQAYRPAHIAAFTSDTLEHDMVRLPPTSGLLVPGSGTSEHVAVFNLCTDTTRNMNGIVTAMHPSEGVWLFRGSPRGSCFGSMFGDHGVCGAFPTSAPLVRRPQSILAQDSPHAVVRLHSSAPKAPQPYMCFDEAYFKTLESMQWNRDNGHVELIPIVVGLP